MHDGVEGTQSLWGCDFDFHCNNFCINNYYKLVGAGAKSNYEAGFVTWSCTAIAAVPHLLRPDPNIYGEGSQVTQVLQLLCLLL